MSAAAVSLLTYVWHYVIARMLYDQLLRPLLHGQMQGALLVAAVATTAFLVGRWSGSRARIRDAVSPGSGRRRLR